VHSQETPLEPAWHQFHRHPAAVLGLVALFIIVLGSICAFLSPYDPVRSRIQERFQPPSLAHPMGTDALGRDVLTRILYGGRISLLVGFMTMVVCLVIGVPVGVVAGYYGGWVDNALMRITDLMLCFPFVFVLILLSAMLRDTDILFLTGEGPLSVALTIGLLSWMTMARLVYASTLSLREREFITAARSIGASTLRIMALHILPNVTDSIIVEATLLVAYAILTESGLSFLGFGVHPRTPTWGNMLNDAQTYMISCPWMSIFPGLMIFISVIAVNYIGDGFRDALDVHNN
jgi:peptide/nickel transport system permease protein